MTRPTAYLVRMVLFLMLVGGGVAVMFAPLREAFMANAPLNGLILGVLLLGLINNFRQVANLYPEIAWLEGFQDSDPDAPFEPKGRTTLMASMATMLEGRRDRLSLSAMSMRSLLDGIASRLDESRDLSRYTIGLLIFLGLLGTFWGLLETVSSIREVIGGLSASSGEVLVMFEQLKTGLQSPLGGMSTAFSSSLFGLAGSLVLGFMDLQAGQAQNRFYNDLEDWLSTMTRIGAAGPLADGDQSVPAYVQALLEQTAESLDKLQTTLSRGEGARAASQASLNAMADKLGTLNDHMRVEQAVMKQLAERQSDLKPILQRLAEGQPGGGGLDEAALSHIRNLDLHVVRLVEEMQAGRDDLIQQVRSEIKLLARTLAAMAPPARKR